MISVAHSVKSHVLLYAVRSHTCIHSSHVNTVCFYTNISLEEPPVGINQFYDSRGRFYRLWIVTQLGYEWTLKAGDQAIMTCFFSIHHFSLSQFTFAPRLPQARARHPGYPRSSSSLHQQSYVERRFFSINELKS